MGHHYLPRRLLRGFSHDKQLIWRLEKTSSGAPRLLPIAQVAQEAAMYTDELEERLNNDIEQPFNALLDRVDDAPFLDGQDVEIASRYVVAKYRRVPRGRARSLSAFPDVADQVEREHLKRIDQLEPLASVGPELGHRARANIARVFEKLRAEDTTWLWHKTLHPEMFPRLISALQQMSWAVWTTPPGMQLLIGDSPVIFDESRGLAHEHAEVVFPIRSDKVLVASWRPAPPIHKRRLTVQQMRRVNALTAMKAQRWVFFKREENWIVPLVLGQRHP